MGTHPNITHNTFPKQSGSLGRRVSVCFRYDPDNRVQGYVVRSDVIEPYRLIIALDDKRFVLATECMYQYIEPPEITYIDYPPMT